MNAPTWLSREGLELHFAFGCVISFVMLWLNASVLANFATVLFVALAHEQAQSNWSDFRRVNGGPWTGCLDVLSFLAGPLLLFVIL